MTGSSKEAWDEVGERFAVFGRARRAPGEQGWRGATTEEGQAQARRGRLDDTAPARPKAFTSVGDTIRDPRAKDDLKLAARSVGDALSVTFQEVSTRSGSGSARADPPGPCPSARRRRASPERHRRRMRRSPNRRRTRRSPNRRRTRAPGAWAP